MADRNDQGMKARAQLLVAQSKPAVRRALEPVARPFLTRLYARVDARAADAMRVRMATNAPIESDLEAKLELARAAAASSASSARELRREQVELRDRVAALEERLRALEHPAAGPST